MELINSTDNTEEEIVPSFIITPEAKKYLLTTARWARLLSITGFIVVLITFLGIIGLFIFFKEMSPVFFPVGIGSIYFILVCSVYLYPLIKLYKFSKLSTDACIIDDASLLEKAFEQQKSLYKFIGIITIAFIVFNFLAIFLIIPLLNFLPTE